VPYEVNSREQVERSAPLAYIRKYPRSRRNLDARTEHSERIPSLELWPSGRLKMRSLAVRPGRLDDQKKGGLSESALSK
jgi:hypothetical protein